MKRLLILCSFIFINTLLNNKQANAQQSCPVGNTCNILITGPTTTNPSITVTIENNPSPPPCSVGISPQSASVLINGTQQFTATVSNCTPSTVTWQVNNITGGNSTIGTINGSGLYTAPANVPTPSTVTITVISVADITKTASALITINTNNNSVMDKYCSPGDVPSFGSNDSYAQLPISCYYTDPSIRTSTGTVRNATAATWNSVWASTQCGDIVEITAGTTLVGNLTIPTKTCSAGSYITLRSSGYANLPAYGTKLTPCYAGITSLPGRPAWPQVSGCNTNYMATIQSTSTFTPLTISTNTSYLVVIGIILTRTSGTGEVLEMVNAYTGGVNHIIFDHIWGEGTANDETNRFMVGNRTNYLALVDSFFTDFHCISGIGACTDAKVFGNGTNTNSTDTDNTYKIVNNYMEGSAQCALSGGSSAVITPTDLEFRNNWCFKPLTWNPSDPSYNGGVSGHAFIVKNMFEFKNFSRALVEGNVFQNVWSGFSQVGNAITLTPKNQFNNLCPLCKVDNVTIRYNKVTTAWQLFQVANVSDGGGTYAVDGQNYSLHDNVGDNLQYATCYQCQSSASTTTAFNDLGAPSSFILNHVDENHNTFVLSGTRTSGFSSHSLGLDAAVAPNTNTFINFQNSVISGGLFDFFTSSSGSSSSCASGKAQIVANTTACWVPNVITGNVIVAPPVLRSGNTYTITSPTTVSYAGSTYTFPSGTCLVSFSTGLAGLFNNYNNGLGGDYTINPSSPCHNSGNDGKDPGANISLVNSYTATANTF